jgi:hypothetical protein
MLWDNFETYRLRQADLQRFLDDTFGVGDFSIAVGTLEAPICK